MIPTVIWSDKIISFIIYMIFMAIFSIVLLYPLRDFIIGNIRYNFWFKFKRTNEQKIIDDFFEFEKDCYGFGTKIASNNKVTDKTKLQLLDEILSESPINMSRLTYRLQIYTIISKHSDLIPELKALKRDNKFKNLL